MHLFVLQSESIILKLSFYKKNNKSDGYRAQLILEVSISGSLPKRPEGKSEVFSDGFKGGGCCWRRKGLQSVRIVKLCEKLCKIHSRGLKGATRPVQKFRERLSRPFWTFNKNLMWRQCGVVLYGMSWRLWSEGVITPRNQKAAFLPVWCLWIVGATDSNMQGINWNPCVYTRA